MKLMNEIGAWFHTKCEQRRKMIAERRSEELKQEAKRKLQVREFGGELHICYNDIPVMPIKGLKWDIATAVDAARNLYAEYNKSKESWHRK